tara:strand:- start:918 stop:2006 length:1089 start_codon:yes stop_codon:yes gene_type:complete
MAVKLVKPINYRSTANITALDFQNIMRNLKICKDFAVAISGGPDSLALVLLSDQYAKDNRLKFTAISIDHSLRSDSKNEIKWIERLMRKYKIKFISLKVKGQKPKSNVMSYARDNRYSLLTQHCKKSKITFLLTAHHLDDEIENFFMRLIRGSGIKGLSSSSVKHTHRKSGVKIIRPLLSYSKKTLIKYLAHKKQKYIFDPTNNDKRHDRSRIRLLTSKLISEGLNKSRLANIIDNLKKAEFAIQSSLSGHVKTLVRIRDKSHIVIRLKGFIKLPEEFQFRIAANILEYVSKKNKKPRAKSVLNVMEKIALKDFRGMTVHGCTIVKKENEIILFQERGRINKTGKKQPLVHFTKKGISDLFI